MDRCLVLKNLLVEGISGIGFAFKPIQRRIADEINRLWAATALLDAEKRFRKVRGHMHMKKLIESLKTFSIEHRKEVA